MPKKAMILAAGHGSRLMPLTADKPKALVEFHGVPMLEIIMKRLIRAGFTDIVINVHHFKDQIIDFVEKNRGFGANVNFSEEDELLDTGGGIKHALPLLEGDTVLFHNVDVLTDIDLEAVFHQHEKNGFPASLIIKDRPTSRYLIFNRSNKLIGWENPSRNIKIMSRPAGKNSIKTAFSGVYILSPEIYNHLPDEKVFSLTPWFIDLSGKLDIMGLNPAHYWFDMGTPENLREAEKKITPDPDNPGNYILV